MHMYTYSSLIPEMYSLVTHTYGGSKFPTPATVQFDSRSAGTAAGKTDIVCFRLCPNQIQEKINVPDQTQAQIMNLFTFLL